MQAVERHHKTRDVEGVPDEDTLTVEGDNTVPRPRTKRKELLPMRTWRLETNFYEMKAAFSGSMWLGVPVSATAKHLGGKPPMEAWETHCIN